MYVFSYKMKMFLHPSSWRLCFFENCSDLRVKWEEKTSIICLLIVVWSGTLGDNKVSTALSIDDGQMRVHHPGTVMIGGLEAAVMLSVCIKNNPLIHTHDHTEHIQLYFLSLYFQGHMQLSPNLKSQSSVFLFEIKRSTQWDYCTAVRDASRLIILNLCRAVIGRGSRWKTNTFHAPEWCFTLKFIKAHGLQH